VTHINLFAALDARRGNEQTPAQGNAVKINIEKTPNEQANHKKPAHNQNLERQHWETRYFNKQVIREN